MLNFRYTELLSELNVETKLANRVIELVMNTYNHFKGFESFDVVGTSALTEYVICKGPQAISWKDQGFQKLFDLLTVGLYFLIINLLKKCVSMGESVTLEIQYIF